MAPRTTPYANGSQEAVLRETNGSEQRNAGFSSGAPRVDPRTSPSPGHHLHRPARTRSIIWTTSFSMRSWVRSASLGAGGAP